MASSINASTTAGVVTTADTSGVLNIQTAGTTAVTVDASQNVGVGITPTTRFHVSSASNTFATVESTNGAAYWQMIGNNATNASYNTLISKYGATTDWSISGGNGTNGIMVFTTGGTERARFNSTGALVLAGGTTTANGIGITFPATQSASSNANTLDDYEEGTFTPSLSFGDGVVGLTYSYRVGIYVKVGNVVSVFIRIALNNKGSSTGHAGVSGLPFTANGTTDVYQVAYVGLIADMSGLTSNPFGQISPNASNFYFYQTTSSNYATLTQTNFLSSSTLNIQFTYLV